jgi:hypothetical protein
MPNLIQNITHVLGFRTEKEVREKAGDYQKLGYSTTQIGPTFFVHVEHEGTPSNFPHDISKQWYVLVATKDPHTDWSG